MADAAHRPVLLDEAVGALAIRPDGVYVDGTFGRGGHSAAILERLGPQGRLLAMDKDPDAAQVALDRFGGDDRFRFKRCSFAMLETLTDEMGVTGRVDGLLLDLGVSSPQLDTSARGFSFQQDGPLDMRMDTSTGPTAAQWLAQADEGEIVQVLRELGEERFAARIARRIVETRLERPIGSTRELAALIESAVPFRERHKHPATRSFQAIRIHINHELEDIEACLAQSLRVLAPGGRLAVISFHSLEDRIVKRFMRDAVRGIAAPRGLPVRGAPQGQTLRLVGKAQRPSEAEVGINPRARSATLRVAERLP